MKDKTPFQRARERHRINTVRRKFGPAAAIREMERIAAEQAKQATKPPRPLDERIDEIMEANGQKSVRQRLKEQTRDSD